ncbi:DUF11 domain-containing protein [Christensenellaceae bacterium OttesenSCG-928-K19]|nr:DUF11 domain-containing protein [Christensenellaceae bacterium OttesenSCG-928-K19]
MRKIGKKGIAWLIAIGLVVSMGIAIPNAVMAARAGDGSYVVDTVADVKTSTPPTEDDGILDGFGSVDSEGRIWVDKSVTAKADGSFDVDLSALAQEYLSVHAGGSGGGGTTSVQADVIFVLDGSGSMSSSGANDVYEESDGNIYRIDAMIRATNEAIKVIMEANPNNRVGVYWYGTTFNTLLPLGSYGLPEEQFNNKYTYLIWRVGLDEADNPENRRDVITNSTLIKDGALYNANPSNTPMSGGTWTQGGVVGGIDTAIKDIQANTNSAGFDKLGKRQPFVFLLSDGGASYGSTTGSNTNAKWWNLENITQYGTGPGSETRGTDATLSGLTAALILSSAVMKDRLSAAYADYNEAYNTAKGTESTAGGTADPYPTNFYTVGLGSSASINGPWVTTNTLYKYAWCGLNPRAMTDRYYYNASKYYSEVGDLTATEDSNEPTNNQGANGNAASRTIAQISALVSAANADVGAGTYDAYLNPEKYIFNSFYRYADTYPKLGDAFDSLAQDVATASQSVTLPVETETETGVGGGGGAIMFADEIGNGMIMNGAPVLAGVEGTVDEDASDSQKTVYTFGSTYKSSAAVSGATITWNISAEDMGPHMYTFSDRKNPSADSYLPADPLVLSYNVKLAENAKGGDSPFYSNAFTKEADDSVTAKTKAVFTPVSDNPYYYFTNKYMGAVGTLEQAGQTGANTVDGDISHYVKGVPVSSNGTTMDTGLTQPDGSLKGVYITYDMVEAAGDTVFTRTAIGKVVDFESADIPTAADSDYYDAFLETICNCAQAELADEGNTTDAIFAFKRGIAKDAADVEDHFAKGENKTETAAYATSAAFENGRMTSLLGNNGKLAVKTGIAKSATQSVAPGGTLAYSITVTNYSDENQTGITVTDLLPDALYIPANITDTTSTSVTVVFDKTSNPLTWSGLAVPANSSVELSFTVKISTGAQASTEYENEASIIQMDGNSLATYPATSGKTVTTVVDGSEVAVDLEKDGSGWTGQTVTLVPDDGRNPLAESDFDAVPDGKYTIYVNGESTGIEVDVVYDSQGDNRHTPKVEYFTLTVGGDAGIDQSSLGGSGVYLKNTVVPVSAAASNGYTFKEWTTTDGGNSVANSGQGSTNIRITKTTTIQATTTKDSGAVNITVNKDGSSWTGHPSITLKPSGAIGSDVTDLDNVPNGTYVIWVGEDNTGMTVTVANGQVTYPTEALVVNYYTVTVCDDGTGCCNPAGSGIYRAGQSVTIDVDMNAGYSFEAWTASGVELASSSVKDNGFTMPAATVTVTASTTPNDDTPYVVNHFVMGLDGQYSDVATAVDNVTGTTDETLTLSELQKASLQVAGGIEFDTDKSEAKSTIIGPETDPAFVISTTAVVAGDGSLVVNLYYERKQHTLTLVEGDGISGVSGGGTYYYGESIDISATLMDDHSFDAWKADTGVADNVTQKDTTITMPSGDLTLTAEAVLRRSAVEVDVEKEDSPWTAGDKPVITLVPKDGGEPVTDLGSVPDGEYWIYANGENTGLSILVNFDNGTQYNETLAYYTLTLVPLDGVQSTHGDGLYLAGEIVPIRAEVKSGYSFESWNESGAARIAGAMMAMAGEYDDILQRETDLLMPARNLTLEAQAKFVGTKVDIGVDKDGNAWTDGDVPAITLVDKDGTVITDLAAVPDGEYKIFADGVDTGQTVVVADGIVTMSSDKLEYYTLTLLAGDGVNSVSGGGVYLAGVEVNINALLVAGYTFVGWSGWEEQLLNAQSTITMPARDVTLTATAEAEKKGTETENGGSTENNNNTTANTGSTTRSSSATKTSDERHLDLYIVMLVGMSACLAGVLWFKKKLKDMGKGG